MPEGTLGPPPVTWIGTRRSYVDNLGRRIEVMETVVGDNQDRPDNMPLYLAHGVAMVNTPEGSGPMPFTFPIEADSIKQAFDRYDELKEKGAQDFIENRNNQHREMMEQQAKQLVMPNGQDVDAIAKHAGIQRR